MGWIAGCTSAPLCRSALHSAWWSPPSPGGDAADAESPCAWDFGHIASAPACRAIRRKPTPAPPLCRPSLECTHPIVGAAVRRLASSAVRRTVAVHRALTARREMQCLMARWPASQRHQARRRASCNGVCVAMRARLSAGVTFCRHAVHAREFSARSARGLHSALAVQRVAGRNSRYVPGGGPAGG
jgi:hypothetical protein